MRKAASDRRPARWIRRRPASAAANSADSETGYDPGDMQQHTALLEATYRHIHAVRAGALVVFHASFACEVTILMRKHCEVDLFNLTFGKEDPPLSATRGRAARIMGSGLFQAEVDSGRRHRRRQRR